MPSTTRARPGPRPRAPGAEYRLLSAPESPPDPPPSTSARQRRRWNELWSHPIAGSWDPVTDGPSVARLIHLEDGEARDELKAREVDQISRLRRQLLMSAQARRLAGVAIPGDGHVDEERPTGAADGPVDYVYRPAPLPAVEDVPNLDDIILRRLDRDLRMYELITAECERDGVTPHPSNFARECPGPLYTAARAELVRRGIPPDNPNTDLYGRPL